MDDFKLSEHFSFFELTGTSHEELQLANRLDAIKYKKQLTYNAHALEEIRYVLGVPLKVSSGYRNNALNIVVKGSSTSKHKIGLCSDILPIGMTVQEAFKKLSANKDKLHSARKIIIEGVGKDAWLHCQAKQEAKEVLELYTSSDTKTFTKVS